MPCALRWFQETSSKVSGVWGSWCWWWRSWFQGASYPAAGGEDMLGKHEASGEKVSARGWNSQHRAMYVRLVAWVGMDASLSLLSKWTQRQAFCERWWRCLCEVVVKSCGFSSAWSWVLHQTMLLLWFIAIYYHHSSGWGGKCQHKGDGEKGRGQEAQPRAKVLSSQEDV